MADPVQAVAAALMAGSSGQAAPQSRQEAWQALEQWSSQPGFYPMLQSLFLSAEADTALRMQAAIQFKNGVARHWQEPRGEPRRDAWFIAEEDKQQIRVNLLNVLDEPEETVSRVLAEAVSAIARHDVPERWPSLLNDLLGNIDLPNPLRQWRALYFGYYVIKKLASRCLPRHRRVFSEVTRLYFGEFFGLWQKELEAVGKVMSGGGGAEAIGQMTHRVTVARFILKILRKLVVSGNANLAELEGFDAFIATVLDCLRKFAALREQLVQADGVASLVAAVEKTLVLCGKVLMDLQTQKSTLFFKYTELALQYALQVIVSESEVPRLERSIVHAMRLIHDAIGCGDCKNTPTARALQKYIRSNQEQQEFGGQQLGSGSKPGEMDPRVIMAIRQCFSADLLLELTQALVFKHLLISDEELARWNEWPEEYVVGEVEGEAWKYDCRPCAGHLLNSVVLLDINRMGQVMARLALSNSEDLRQRDAIYHALGLTANALFEHLDFSAWLVAPGGLAEEFQATPVENFILRRRILLLLQAWIRVDLKEEVRPTLYACVVPALGPRESVSVRLTAASVLETSVNDFGYRPEHLAPHLELAVQSLFELLCTAKECDSKLRLLGVIVSLIDRVSDTMISYIQNIAEYMPRLWEQSADDSDGLLRCGILKALCSIVKIVGRQSQVMHEFLLPVIKFSTDVRQPAHVYLCLEGMLLWLEVLKCAPELTEPLLALFVNLGPLVDRDGDRERRKSCIDIVGSYVLMHPGVLMQAYAAEIAEMASALAPSMPVALGPNFGNMMETILICAPESLPHFGNCLLVAFQSMLEAEQKKLPLIPASFLSIFLRVLVQSPEVFEEIIQRVAELLAIEPAQAVDNFFVFWIEQMDKIVQTKWQKLSALALGSILTMRAFQLVVRRHGAVIVDKLLHYLMQMHLRGDSREESGSISEVDLMVEFMPSPPSPSENIKPEAARKQALCEKDVVYCINLKQYYGSQLAKLSEHLDLGALMSQVPASIAQQLALFNLDGGG